MGENSYGKAYRNPYAFGSNRSRATAGRQGFNGRALDAALQRMSPGAARAQELQAAIRQADQAGDDCRHLYFLYRYAGEMTFHGDPAEAIPAAAEFKTIVEEHADALTRGGTGARDAAEMYLMITRMGIDPIVDLPQVSVEQWEEQMRGFRELEKRREMVSLNLPETFPRYSPEDIYGTAALADRFFRQAADIAGRFDARNGSRWFTEDLQSADW